MKEIAFLGTSLKALRSFPEVARREAGFQLRQVQAGFEPEDVKSMQTVGAGMQEIRIWDQAGTFRVLYVARFEDAVYVLHAFEKKTQTTSKRDLELARNRYLHLIEERRKI